MDEKLGIVVHTHIWLFVGMSIHGRFYGLDLIGNSSRLGFKKMGYGYVRFGNIAFNEENGYRFEARTGFTRNLAVWLMVVADFYSD